MPHAYLTTPDKKGNPTNSNHSSTAIVIVELPIVKTAEAKTTSLPHQAT
jgi:hypothetical protein